MSASIEQTGVLQPIIVREVGHNEYQIVAGERRWRAAKRANFINIPVVIRQFTETEVYVIALAENIQRSDLNPREEAEGYQVLVDKMHLTQEDIAEMLGKSRSHVANTLRLLQLSPSLKAKVGSGLLSAGHARALLSVRDPEAVAEMIISKGLSVRDVERIVQEEAEGTEATPPLERKSRGAGGKGQPPAQKDADTRALEKTLTDALGLLVEIDHHGESGELRIRYSTLEQLDGLCHRLNR